MPMSIITLPCHINDVVKVGRGLIGPGCVTTESDWLVRTGGTPDKSLGNFSTYK